MEMGKHCLCLNSPLIPQGTRGQASWTLSRPLALLRGAVSSFPQLLAPHPILSVCPTPLQGYFHITTAAMDSALDLLSQGAGYSLLRAVRHREAWNQALAFPGSASLYFNLGSP